MARVSTGIRLGALCLALLLGAAVAQEERRHVLTDIPEANDDIDAVAVFPADVDVSAGFPSKAPLKILLGFRNNGDVPVNVTHIAASLNVPQMFSFYVTNFTVQRPHVTVEPGKEASFEYPFVLDPALAGHDFVLAATAFYQDETEAYASVFYNATISVLDPVGVFDAQTLVVKLVLLALALGVVYQVMAAAGALPAAEKALKKAAGAGKKAPLKKRETGTGGGASAENNEWLKGTSWKEGKSQ